MRQIEHIEQIVSESFGLWISGLFSTIGGWNPNFSFEERREAFFCVIDRLLRQGKIRFVAPGADCYISPSNPAPRLTIEDEQAQWRVSPEIITSFLRSQWPADAEDENDVALTDYFYSIPAVIWVADDGKLVAS